MSSDPASGAARYEIYSMRRTSSRTTYAIYDNIEGRPVADRHGVPLTFSDRSEAQRQAVVHAKAAEGKG